MARIVNAHLMGSGSAARVLSPAERRRAARRLARAQAANPLRRVRLDCHGWVRDASAVVGDWIWCEPCGDLRPARELKE